MGLHDLSTSILQPNLIENQIKMAPALLITRQSCPAKNRGSTSKARKNVKTVLTEF